MMALVPIREFATQLFVVQTLLAMVKSPGNLVELIENAIPLVIVLKSLSLTQAHQPIPTQASWGRTTEQ